MDQSADKKVPPVEEEQIPSTQLQGTPEVPAPQNYPHRHLLHLPDLPHVVDLPDHGS